MKILIPQAFTECSFNTRPLSSGRRQNEGTSSARRCRTWPTWRFFCGELGSSGTALSGPSHMMIMPLFGAAAPLGADATLVQFHRVEEAATEVKSLAK